MTGAQHSFHEALAADAERHFARLHHVLGLILQITAQSAPAIDTGLDQGAKVSGAYGGMSRGAAAFRYPARRTSAWAASGLDALASVKEPRSQPRAAAFRLADELERAHLCSGKSVATTN
ncbi:MAG: hypothetical protein H0W74_11965 [Sphingosinicella sp.]|nr:hypothetical protein [Sphingosinicella sp.]